MIYGAEEVFFETLDFIKNNINSKIDEINTEYNDGIILKHINSNAYSVMTLDEKSFNENPFIFINIANISSESVASSVSETISIEITVVISDNQEKDLARKLFRYQYAIKDLVLRKYNKFNSPIEIQNLVPVEFSLQNTSERHRAIGVVVTRTIFN